jgi:Immunoglobulin-like domain of bacterial spore germination/Sporulation and spore germination
MKRPIAVLTAALTLCACGPDRSGTLGQAPTGAPRSPTTTASTPATQPQPQPPPSTSGPAEPADAAPTPATGRTVTVQLWFTRDGTIVPTRRTRPYTLATSRLALTELVAGPSRAEATAGMTSAVPPDTTVTIAGISGGVATVSFPPAFYTGGGAVVRLRQAQVVYTLTQFPSVSRVALQSAGEPVGAPVRRSDYADLLALIVVSDPVVGQRVSSPVTVAGTANVFEATVSLRLLDASGREIATRFTTATCGSGCRGSWSVSVPYRLGRTQRGTVQVYEVSAKDGSRQHVVNVPVMLSAAPG